MKTFIKLLLLAAVALPSWVTTAAQEAPSLIVQTEYDATGVICNGTTTNQYVPVFSTNNFASYYSNIASQWIYPSAYFVGNNGIFNDVPSGSTIKINKITFHASTSAIPNAIKNATVIVRIGEVETNVTTIANANTMNSNRETMTTVYTGLLSPCCSGQTMTIRLDTPYEYTRKNLIVDIYVGTTSNATCQWYGVNSGTNGSSCYYYRGQYTGDNFNRASFLPKMTVDYSYSKWESPETIDFGGVKIENTKTLQAKIVNPTEESLTAKMTATSPFGVNPASPEELTIPAKENDTNGEASFNLTFSPAQSISYSGTLNLEIGEQTAHVPLKGVGKKEGPEAIRDEAFFKDITYNWTDEDGNSHTSNLAEIATDPDQIIALLKEVYTNQNIPGNYKRGYTSTGGSDDHDNVVLYTGVGRITSNSATTCDNSYGWNIPGQVLGSNYKYMKEDQYKPYDEGVTLLLLEIVDTFTPTTTSSSTHDYATLRGYFKDAIKSARVITQAKRTGEGFDRGTLFKIDCDKMNKFYLIAKGQLQWHKESVYSSTGYGYPVYSSGYHDSGLDNSYLNSPAFLCHMFEQLSPSEGNAEDPLSDGYKMFVTEMKSFGIKHDCPNAPYVNGGHHFMMYGQESAAADCQDIRDMMFLVPDYRMMDWTGRGTSGSSGSNRSQDYFYYHENHRPTIGVFVIHQDEVEEVTKTDDYYMLKLTWDSNLDEFLPADQQEYQLWQVVIDEFGVSHYEQVYYMNENGEYTDENGVVVDTPVPIVLERSASADKKTYNHVYVKRDDSSKTVTYAVRGQDKGHFLSLQMSNEQSYFIQGKDPAEVAMMSSATVYSRFEAQAVRNCYSNKLKITSSPRSIKTSYLPNESEMSIVRSHVLNNGSTSQPTYVNETVATLTINTATKKFTVTGPVMDDVSNLFPVGPHDGKIAGYHANKSSEIDYTTDGEYINFDIELWDNFVVDVSANEHPGLYTYQLKFSTPSDVAIVGTENGHEAYSNPIPVLVYKTDSKINKPLTLAQVNGDTSNNPDYSPGDVEFGAQVQLSSKTEILRYDAYRWNEGVTRSIIDYGGETDEDEEDYDPNGIAGNQGESYSVSMNAIGTADYYVGDEVPVTTGAPRNWVTFVDYYPTNLETGGAYTYAPVVELFTRGYQAGSTTLTRGDYNTYGGPLKNTAVGKMTLQIDPELNSDQAHSFMSTYKWQEGDDENTKWYCYYDIPIKFTLLDVPADYEIYKVRAWRKVDDVSILGEEYPSRADRKQAKYLYEEMNFGDDMGGGVTMSIDGLFRKPLGASGEPYSYAVGSRNPQVDGWFETSEATLDTEHETHATFGALRINTKDGEPYSMESLNATFKVRAYFVKTSDADGRRNPLVTVPTRDDVANPADFDYYIAEGEITFKSGDYNNIITGINGVKMDVNREVVGVTYVNTVGQASSTPWSGINIVVTRYSDGSTTTKKVLK
jgi:hypothetical protein